MKDKTALKFVPKPEATPDPQPSPEVLKVAEQFSKMGPEILRDALKLVHRANELDHPVVVERWDLQQVFDLLYSIELTLEQWIRIHDEKAADIYYICKPMMNQFTALFDSEANLGRVLVHGGERRVCP